MSDLDKCKKYLRGVLMAHKGGVLISQIVAKYHEIIGCWKLNQFFYSSRADRLTDKELGDLLASTYMTMTK